MNNKHNLKEIYHKFISISALKAFDSGPYPLIIRVLGIMNIRKIL